MEMIWIILILAAGVIIATILGIVLFIALVRRHGGQLQPSTGRMTPKEPAVPATPKQTIGDLSASQLARHAANVFLFRGRHVEGFKLIYHALIKNRFEPLAIRCLSDYLDQDGLQVYSAIALEYGISPSSPLSPADRTELDDLLFLSKWTWGFSRHISGSKHLEGDEFKLRHNFTVDEIEYQHRLDQVIAPAGSLDAAFDASHRLAGLVGSLLRPRKSETKGGLEELVYPDHFEETPAYAKWLMTTTDELDRLEEQRQKKIKPNTPQGPMNASEGQSLWLSPDESLVLKAEQGDATAQYFLGRCYELGIGVEKDEREAVKWYTKSAEQRNENAKNALRYIQRKGT
jgi:hypothetical protein